MDTQTPPTNFAGEPKRGASGENEAHTMPLPANQEPPHLMVEMSERLSSPDAGQAKSDLLNSDWFAMLYNGFMRQRVQSGNYYVNSLFVRFIARTAGWEIVDAESFLRFCVIPRAKQVSAMYAGPKLEPTYGAEPDRDAQKDIQVLPPSLPYDIAEAIAHFALFEAFPYLSTDPLLAKEAFQLELFATQHYIASEFVAAFSVLLKK